MVNLKQLEGRQLKGQELATFLRTQARKILPEYDEAMGLKGKGKGLSLPQIIALQTMDAETTGPNSIQFRIMELHSKTPKEQAQEIILMLKGDASVSVDFVIRVLHVAALETQAEAAMCEERAGHYLGVATAIEVAIELQKSVQKTKLERLRDVAMEIAAFPGNKAPNSLDTRILLDDATYSRLQNRLRELGISDTDAYNVMYVLIQDLSGYTKSLIEQTFAMHEKVTVNAIRKSEECRINSPDGKELVLTSKDLDSLLPSGLTQEAQMKLRIAEIARLLSLPNEKQGVDRQFCDNFEKTISGLAKQYGF